MWLADTPDGLREPERSGEAAHCPGCREPVLGKCGDILGWHWAHRNRVDCDTWSEPMTAWHKDWQAAAPAYRREVPLGRHRADVVTVDGRIYEIQHSALDPPKIEEREDFYRGDLVWLWDAREAYDKGRINLKRDQSSDRRQVAFHWPQSRRSIGLCGRVVLLDLGEYVLGADRHNDTMSWGTGRLWEPDVVKARLATEGPCPRRYPTCADPAGRARLTPPDDADLPVVQPEPCCICGAGTMKTSPYGQPHCDDCATCASTEELARCEACGLPMLYQDAAIDGCHAGCIPQVTA